jgi:hypothetical protein
MARLAATAFLEHRKIGFILFEITRVIPLLQERNEQAGCDAYA